MNRGDAWEQFKAADFLRLKAIELKEQALEGCDMPRPGAFVRDVRSGAMFVVLSTGEIDGFRDSGKKEPDSWLWYEVVQDGEPPTKWEKEAGLA